MVAIVKAGAHVSQSTCQPPVPGNRIGGSEKKRRVLLVDDHPVTRTGFARLINDEDTLAVCGEADSAAAVLAVLETIQPDVVIVDIAMKPVGGIELTKQIGTKAPHVPVLVVSMHDEEIYAERAFLAGARGYVMKEDAGEHVIAALQCVLRGEIYLSARMKARMIRRFVNKKEGNPLYSIETLTAREMTVFRLIGDGASTREVAEHLGLSAKTIDSYREQLKLKLFLKSGEELVRHAVQWGQPNV